MQHIVLSLEYESTCTNSQFNSDGCKFMAASVFHYSIIKIG